MTLFGAEGTHFPQVVWNGGARAPLLKPSSSTGRWPARNDRLCDPFLIDLSIPQIVTRIPSRVLHQVLLVILLRPSERPRLENLRHDRRLPLLARVHPLDHALRRLPLLLRRHKNGRSVLRP